MDSPYQQIRQQRRYTAVNCGLILRLGLLRGLRVCCAASLISFSDCSQPPRCIWLSASQKFFTSWALTTPLWKVCKQERSDVKVNAVVQPELLQQYLHLIQASKYILFNPLVHLYRQGTDQKFHFGWPKHHQGWAPPTRLRRSITVAGS